MKIKTKCFGQVEISEEKVIHFEEGIPGFEELHDFAYIDSEDGVFNYLQSIENEAICFVVIDPYQYMEDYAPVISENYFQKLGGGATEDFILLTVTCIRDNVEESTVNLAGPLLINVENKKGVQVITEDKKYTTRHKLMSLLNGEKKLC